LRTGTGARNLPSAMSGFDPNKTTRLLAEGQRIDGRYRLDERVGRGGNGVVWRAYDEELNLTVALKFLPDELAHDANSLSSFRSETRKGFDLTHPHIVRVHDLVQHDGLAAIKMEFVDGPNLDHRRAQAPGGCLDTVVLSPWVAHLCAALAHAHKKEIVHRDIKPQNLLLTKDGELKVADFGIARRIAETRAGLPDQAGAGVAGTLAYMSPQHLAGHAPTPADDMYAVGATLYEMLTGRPPYYAGDIMTQIREGKLVPIERRRADLKNHGGPVPPVWQDAIFKCLSKEASKRPTATELADLLAAPRPGTQPPHSGPGVPVAEGWRLVAVMSTDVVNFSPQMEGRRQDQVIALLQADHDRMLEIGRDHGGKLANSAGDSLLLYFFSVGNAVQCALKIQREFGERTSAFPKALVHRIGINSADVHFQPDGDILGDGVNKAARLQSYARPGAVCVSDSVHSMVAGKFDMSVGPRETVLIKNTKLTLWHVRPAGVAPPPPPIWRIPALALAVIATIVGSVWMWRDRSSPPPARPVVTATPKDPPAAVELKPVVPASVTPSATPQNAPSPVPPEPRRSWQIGATTPTHIVVSNAAGAELHNALLGANEKISLPVEQPLFVEVRKGNGLLLDTEGENAPPPPAASNRWLMTMPSARPSKLVVSEAPPLPIPVAPPFEAEVGSLLSGGKINEDEAAWLRTAAAGGHGEAENALVKQLFSEELPLTLGRWRARTAFTFVPTAAAIRAGTPQKKAWALDVVLPPGKEKIRLIRIEPGTYSKGAVNRMGGVKVTISRAFFIGVYEVTNQQFRAVTNRMPSWFNRRADGSFNADFPAEKISLAEVKGETGFVSLLSARLGDMYGGALTADLPTDDEWEYACRAGLPNADPVLRDVARYNQAEDRGPQPVGRLQPNAWGLYDMLGNVQEWTNNETLRGGSWKSPAGRCQVVSVQDGSLYRSQDKETGFRLVLRIQD